MSLATITIEQQGPALWQAWVEAGYPRCTRQQLTAITLPSLMIAIHRHYSDVVPEKQIGLLLESETLDRFVQPGRPKTKHVMSDEHKRKMAEGRTRSAAVRRAAKAMDEAVETAEPVRRFTRDEMHDAEPARTDD